MLPAGNGSMYALPPPLEWHAVHRALPLRGLVRIGCTFVLNTSKFKVGFAEADAAAAMVATAGRVRIHEASVCHSGLS